MVIGVSEFKHIRVNSTQLNSTQLNSILFANHITFDNEYMKCAHKRVVYALVQGPVVQNIVSITSSLRGRLIKCFTIL